VTLLKVMPGIRQFPLWRSQGRCFPFDDPEPSFGVHPSGRIVADKKLVMCVRGGPDGGRVRSRGSVRMRPLRPEAGTGARPPPHQPTPQPAPQLLTCENATSLATIGPETYASRFWAEYSDSAKTNGRKDILGRQHKLIRR